MGCQLMSCLVKSHRPNGVTYVYRSTSVWDSSRKMSIPKRKLIGKINPETGEIVPTGKRGRRRKDTEQVGAQAPSENLVPEMDRINEEVRSITEAIAGQQEQYQAVLQQARENLVKMQTLRVELKKSEATLAELIKAIQPLV